MRRTWILLLLAGGCQTASPASEPVRISEVTLPGDLDCFRIETPAATYLYGKRGAGFAGILDPDGHDWIGYRHGGKAAGEYRGLPKCGQPVKYFHCGYGYGPYANENPFTSRVTERGPGRVRIVSESRDGKSLCEWEFTPTGAILTLRRIAQATYWFLYEGTPGGELRAEEDVSLRPGGRRTALSEPWEEAVAWTAFVSSRSPYALLCVSPDVRPASYTPWPYAPEADGGYRQMTVFGWGRPGWKDPRQHEPQLRELPARFAVAMVRGTERTTLEAAAQAAFR
ncbi:MAG TPA: hypothetical protein VEN81_11995 [Planctomycetota bacterium]|nr:hypothetical protein [Planctomycetota bacterium]